MKLRLPGSLIITSAVTAFISVTEMIHLSHGAPSLPKLISMITLLWLIYERCRSFKKFEKDASEIAPDSVQRKRLLSRAEGETAFAIFAYQIVVWVGIAFAQH